MKEVRPTSGKVLAALFSILGPILESGKEPAFLDLFAGTGRVGIEALKRGASTVVFVETLKSRADEIRRALPKDCAVDVTVLSLELRRGLAWLRSRGRTFDIIFADPPYGEGWPAVLPAVRDLKKVLKPGGLLIIEHMTREPAAETQEDWVVVDVRAYGETTLSFLKPKTPPSEEVLL